MASVDLNPSAKNVLLVEILADDNPMNSSDWVDVFMQVISGSDKNFKLRMDFASMSDGFVKCKNVVCRLLLLRPNTTATEIFQALKMFDTLLKGGNEDTNCLEAVAKLLDTGIEKISYDNEDEVRAALRGVVISLTGIECW